MLFPVTASRRYRVSCDYRYVCGDAERASGKPKSASLGLHFVGSGFSHERIYRTLNADRLPLVDTGYLDAAAAATAPEKATMARVTVQVPELRASDRFEIENFRIEEVDASYQAELDSFVTRVVALWVQSDGSQLPAERVTDEFRAAADTVSSNRAASQVLAQLMMKWRSSEKLLSGGIPREGLSRFARAIRRAQGADRFAADQSDREQDRRRLAGRKRLLPARGEPLPAASALPGAGG